MNLAMAWGFRRSVSFLGIRFTFSKSGISTSVGGHGLRLTSGPRGVYVTAGAGGFYYRQRLDTSPRRTASVPLTSSPPSVTASELHSTKTFASGAVDGLTGISQEEFVSSLNEHTSRGHIQIAIITVSIITLMAAIARNASPRAVFLAAGYGLIAFALGRYIENRRRRFLLVYDLTPEEASRYENLGLAATRLAQSGSFRAVKIVGQYSDWKRNAGATRGFSFDGASIREAAPPYIMTNVQPWRLSTQGLQLFLLPDRVLVRSHGKFAAFSYAELKTSSGTSSFVWTESLPSDAMVTGSTWQYVRRDGGPDRRFSNNRQIPIVQVAYLGLETSTGLEIALQTTACDGTQLFVEAHARYAHRSGQEHRESSLGNPPQSEDLRRALATLGLEDMPTSSDLKRVYRELVQRNHPDKYGSAGAEIQDLAADRMKEINAAYELLAPLAADDGPAQDPPIVPPQIQPESVAPTWWREPEFWASLGAVLACALLYGIARSIPDSTPPPPIAMVAPIVARTVSPAPTAPAPPPKERTLGACVLRGDPTPQGFRIARVVAGAIVEVLDSQKGWRKVRLDSGPEGWTGPTCWTKKPRKRPNAGEADSGPFDDSERVPARDEPAKKKSRAPGLDLPGQADPFAQ